MNLDQEYEDIVDCNYRVNNNVAEEKEEDTSMDIHDEDIECSVEDFKDLEKIEHLYGETAKDCCKNCCNKIIPKDFAVDKRLQFLELEKAEQDLILLAHLQTHRQIGLFKDIYGKYTVKNKSQFKKEPEHNRQIINYYIADIPVCRKMYFFLYDVGISRHKNLVTHFDLNGLNPRVHKLSGKVPSRANVLSVDDITKTVKYIEAVAEKTAIALPGRMPQFRDFNVMKLPSSETKSSLYKKYQEDTKNDMDVRAMSFTSFRTIWSTYCPYITTMKPADDLCDKCRDNNLEISRCANLPDEEKAKIISVAMEHLQKAKKQREFYNLHRANIKLLDQDPKQQSSIQVLSFDYAQNVSYPSSPQQVGKLYFKVPRKCGIFGIHDESNGVQTNFLIDEADNAGKGANSVISMIDYYLSNHHAGEVILFSDNCDGQNKNNAMMHYLLWRVMTGKNLKIALHFLLTGHTKFSPDRNFGIVKSKYARADVDCLQDLMEVVNTSSSHGYNVALPTVDPSTNVRNVEWKKWDEFFKQNFRPIPHITNYHHFVFFPNGEIRAKKFVDSTEEIVHPEIKLNKNAAEIKNIRHHGLSNERQWYLFDEIRQFCTNQNKKDAVAPPPNCPKKRKLKDYN